MTEEERAKLIARLDAIESKMDQMLEFRDLILKIATSKLGGKLLLGMVK